MAEQDEHAGDVRRRSSIALALTAGGHKAEAGSHCRSRSRVPSAKRAQHALHADEAVRLERGPFRGEAERAQ